MGNLVAYGLTLLAVRVCLLGAPAHAQVLTAQEAYDQVLASGILKPTGDNVAVTLEETFDIGHLLQRQEKGSARDNYRFQGVRFEGGIEVSAQTVDAAFEFNECFIHHFVSNDGVSWNRSLEFVQVTSDGLWIAEGNTVKQAFVLENSTLAGSLLMANANLGGLRVRTSTLTDVDVSSAEIRGPTEFENCTVQRGVFLSGSVFGGDVVFRGCPSISFVDLKRAAFYGDVHFKDSSIATLTLAEMRRTGDNIEDRLVHIEDVHVKQLCLGLRAAKLVDLDSVALEPAIKACNPDRAVLKVLGLDEKDSDLSIGLVLAALAGLGLGGLAAARWWRRRHAVKIFISYRRALSAPHAQLLRKELPRPPFQVFVDVEGLHAGVFKKQLDRAILSADVVLVVMEKDWASRIDQEETRAEAEPKDWIRYEVTLALDNQKLIVPVLVEDADLPKPVDLPERLRPVPAFEAVRLRMGSLDADAAELRKKILQGLKTGETVT